MKEKKKQNTFVDLQSPPHVSVIAVSVMASDCADDSDPMVMVMLVTRS